MTVLPERTIAQVEKIGEADILVGIPSFRAAKTISHVIKSAGEGLARYFPQLKGVIVNSDGGSEDNTMGVALSTPLPSGIEKIVTPYFGFPGKGSAFHAIFEIADRLKTKICVVVDSDLLSLTPEWIRLLGEPIWKHGYRFVVPYYLRHKHDGTITNTVAYPLTQALYGRKIRQPIGGEFGFSGGLAKVFSHENVWETDIARFGIDIFMTTTALNEGIKICQAAMGVKLHDSKNPATHLKPMFEQVVGTIFGLMKRYEIRWRILKKSESVELFGKIIKSHEPVSVEVNLPEMITQFKKGFNEERDFWERILEKNTLSELSKISEAPDKEIFFPDELWAKVVYDSAVAFNFYPTEANLVLPALFSLFLGRTAFFIKETAELSTERADLIVSRGARVFEKLKPYLITRWDKTKSK